MLTRKQRIYMSLTDDKEFADLMHNHMRDVIIMMLEKEQFFGIMAHVNEIHFEPELPKAIHDNFSPISYFSFENYTFESLILHDEHITFEAGFGEEAIGSVLSVPLHAILQIIVNEVPLLINMAKKHAEDPYEKSRKMFLSNPKNKKLLDD